MNGVIVIDKPDQFTSFDVAAKMRGMLHTKKIGHGGTLDPHARGVLPVFIGNATRLADYLKCSEKTYEAEITLGIRTDTEDIWGQILEEQPFTGSREEAADAVLSFVGAYDQIPPMYSAKKVGGKKLYELARAGLTIERRPEHVRILDIEISRIELPKISFTVSCSKGTYIRTLASDIGEKLGCGACMSALRRTRHGRFTIEQAVTLEQLQQAVNEGREQEYLIPVENLFSDYGKLVCTEEGTKALMNGNKLKPASVRPERQASDGRFAVYGADGRFYAVYVWSAEEGVYRAEKMFLQ